MLRTTFSFPDVSASREAHNADHLALHRRYNAAIYADDYDSIQAALDAASARNIPVVYLNPASAYDVDSTLTIPQGVTLDGGAVSGGSGGAELRATAALDPMITLGGWYTGVRGCTLNGNYQASVGVMIPGVHSTLLEHNYIKNFPDPAGAAVRAGGALYSTFRRNIVSNCAGYGLDALNAYSSDPEATYYGINHGLSEQNVWGAKMGGMRVEGLLTSICDDFELRLDGEAAVVVGGTVSTTLNMQTPYFELSLGNAAALIGIKQNGSSRIHINGGQIFGESIDSPGSVAILSQTGYGMTVIGMVFARWETALKGAVATAMPLLVGGNYFTNCGTISDLSTGSADVAMFHVPE